MEVGTRIGLYNSKIDSIGDLGECPLIATSFEELKSLKRFISTGDTLVIASAFSLKGAEADEFYLFAYELKLEIEIVSDGITRDNDRLVGLSQAIKYIGMLRFIESNKEDVRKLID